MLSHIPEALAALNNLKNLVQSLSDAKTNAALREQAVELNFAIIDATNAVIAIQTQYQTLLEEKDSLKKELMNRENWDAEASKYTLIEIDRGVSVYALKPEYKSTATPHWLCPNCYQNRKPSILQRGESKTKHHYVFRCPYPSCSLELDDRSNSALP